MQNKNVSELQTGLIDVLCLCVTCPTDDASKAWRALGAIQEVAIHTLFGDNPPECLKRRGAWTLAERVTQMLGHYMVHNGGALPESLSCNPADALEVVKILKALDLSRLGVICDSNVAAGEVTLPKKDGGQ